MSKDILEYVKPYINESFKKKWTEKCKDLDVSSDFVNRGNILPPVKKIIVIGDLHGDWEMTLKVLDHAKVIRRSNPCKWIGKDTVIVQLGDQIDRCRGSGSQCHTPNFTKNDENNDWKILKYMTDLHKEALKSGGAVYSLLGNHELMNVEGDFRYVSYKGLAEYGNSSDLSNGKDKRKQDFSREGGKISTFLGCTRYGVLVIGSNLFVHGGITDLMKKKYPGLNGLADLNRVVSRYLWGQINKDDNASILDSADYSPFWNRILGTCGTNLGDENSICSKLEEQLKIYQVPQGPSVSRIIIGHTPQYFYNLGANKTCNGKVIRADVGLSQAFDTADKNLLSSNGNERNANRKPQYVEILNDKEINIKIIN